MSIAVAGPPHRWVYDTPEKEATARMQQPLTHQMEEDEREADRFYMDIRNSEIDLEHRMVAKVAHIRQQARARGVYLDEDDVEDPERGNNV